MQSRLKTYYKSAETEVLNKTNGSQNNNASIEKSVASSANIVGGKKLINLESLSIVPDIINQIDIGKLLLNENFIQSGSQDTSPTASAKRKHSNANSEDNNN